MACFPLVGLCPSLQPPFTHYDHVTRIIFFFNLHFFSIWQQCLLAFLVFFETILFLIRNFFFLIDETCKFWEANLRPFLSIPIRMKFCMEVPFYATIPMDVFCIFSEFFFPIWKFVQFNFWKSNLRPFLSIPIRMKFCMEVSFYATMPMDVFCIFSEFFFPIRKFIF